MIKKPCIVFIAILLIFTFVFTAGCNDKGEYTIDEPFDFSAATPEKETEPTPDPDSTIPPSESITKPEQSQPTATPEKDNVSDKATEKPENTKAPEKPSSATPTPVPEKPNQDEEVVEDKTFQDVADENVVPEDVVEKMTTKAILETYLNYPMIKLLIFEIDPMKAYETWLDETDNCVDELLDRKDALDVIIARYKSMVDSELTEHITDEADLDEEFRIDWLELLLLQDDVKEEASLKQKKEILEYAKKRDKNLETNGYAVSDLYPSLAEKYKLG